MTSHFPHRLSSEILEGASFSGRDEYKWYLATQQTCKWFTKIVDMNNFPHLMARVCWFTVRVGFL
jgi:hypothetical protein